MTSWEDVIFTAGQVCFGVSLLGMLRSAQKPPMWSAAMYAFWVWAFTAADINLGLPLATVTAAINAAMWTWLAWQAWRRDRARRAHALGLYRVIHRRMCARDLDSDVGRDVRY